MKLTRRNALTIAASAALAPAWGQTQTAFTGPIKIIVPYPPGAALDTVTRIIAQALSPHLGQAIVVENREGAGSQIGTALAAKSKPDGQTWLVNAIDVFTLLPVVSNRLTFSVNRDFSFVARLVSVPYAIHVNSNVPVRTTAELIAYAKAHPGELKYGSLGPGSLPHVAMEMFTAEAGVQMLHVPYKGMAPVVNDVIAGHIDAAVVSPATMAPHVASGKVRTLCLTTSQRSATWSQLPTAADAGLRKLEAHLGIGMAAPAGTPPALIARMSEKLSAVLQEPGVSKQLSERGFDLAYLDPGAFTAHIKSESERWKQVTAQLSISMD